MLKQEVLKQVQDEEGKNIPQLFRLIRYTSYINTILQNYIGEITFQLV